MPGSPSRPLPPNLFVLLHFLTPLYATPLPNLATGPNRADAKSDRMSLGSCHVYPASRPRGPARPCAALRCPRCPAWPGPH